MPKDLVTTVDATPSWLSCCSIIAAGLMEGSHEAQKISLANLQHMARVADGMVKAQKEHPEWKLEKYINQP